MDDDDLKALQRLRLARRNWTKRDKELDRAEQRMMKANGKLYRAMDAVEGQGLSLDDPRSWD